MSIGIPVPPQTPDATSTVKGRIKLTGDLGGTADSPTVPALVTLAEEIATKQDELGYSPEDVQNKIQTITDSTDSYPSSLAVKTAIADAVAAGAPDATTEVKGKVKLAGDLAGTADLPTVPGLATKEPANANIQGHIAIVAGNPHGTSKANVGLGNVPNVDATNPANISQDSTHRFVTDTEKTYWGNKQEALTYTPEDSANKVAGFQVTPDDTHYPTEKLVKDSLDTKQAALGFTPENVSNKRTSFQATPDDTHYPSEKLVKDSLDAKQNSLGYSPENLSNKSTDATLGGETSSDTLYPSQKAAKTYIDQIIAAANALVYKGIIDCSGNPNYPAADAGFVYVVSVDGKIGGASGVSVKAGDLALCNTDGTPSGDQAAVGTKWNLVSRNLDGVVYGPSSAVDGSIALFDTTTGKLLKDSAKTIVTSLGADNTTVPTSGAVATALSGKQDALGFTPIPNTRKVNGHELSSDVTVTATDVGLGNVPNVDATNPANITQDSTHRFVSDTEKSTWSGKQDALGFTPEDAANKDTTSTLGTSDTKYPSQKAVNTALDTRRQYISAGVFGAEPGFTDLGTGYASVPSCTVLLHSTTDFSGTLEKYTVPQNTNLGPFDGSGKYICVDYNGGSPVYKVGVTSGPGVGEVIINGSSIIPLYKCWYVGTTLHSLSGDAAGQGLANKIANMMSSTHPYARAGNTGLMISETNRVISVTSAYVYAGTFGQVVSSFTSATDLFTKATVTNGTWTYTNPATTYDNANYNPTTGPVAYSNSSKFGTVWYYRSVGDVKEVFYVLGVAEYNNAGSAALEPERTDLPSVIKQHCILIGRSIIQSGASAGSTVSAFNVVFSGSSTIAHNDTSNLNDGDYQHLTALEKARFTNFALYVKEYTGFSDPSAVVENYNSANRTVTLTGTWLAFWRGDIVTALTTGWVSDPHPDTVGVWFLYYNGSSYIWSTDSWSFDMMMIAIVNYGTVHRYGIREPHGLMQYLVHQEAHEAIGTYKQSGGALSGYTLSSTTPANRRPLVAATYVKDEDIITINPALSTNSYTQFFLSSASTVNYNLSATEIVPLVGNQPRWNQLTGGSYVQTAMSNNTYMTVWLLAIPVTADAGSQAYRYLWVQGQSNGTLSSEQALTSNSLSLGTLNSQIPEFVFIARAIIRYSSSNWDIVQVDSLAGTRNSQVSTSSTGLTSVATDASITGNGTSSSPLSIATFEQVSKNLRAYPYALNYVGGVLATIVYTVGTDTITKTFNYTGGVLTSIVLSGTSLPSGISTTKTLNYTGGVLTSVAYS